MSRLLLVMILGGCASGRYAVPPCNAWIIVYGAADFTLDCPTPATSDPSQVGRSTFHGNTTEE